MADPCRGCGGPNDRVGGSGYIAKGHSRTRRVYRDPKCVHVDYNLAHAQLVVGWLSSHGIAAEVMNEMTLGGFEGLVSILPSKLSFRGVEVWVNEPANAGRARQLIAEHAAELQASRSNRTGEVEAVCDECDQTTTFPAA